MASLCLWGIHAKHDYSFTVLIVFSLVFSQAWSSPRSFSSSSLSDGDIEVIEDSLSIPPSSNNDKDFGHVNHTNSTSASNSQCGCGEIVSVYEEIKQTKGLCVDAALLLEGHVTKINTLQLAVDGLAAIVDTNFADVSEGEESPVIVHSSSDTEDSLSSSFPDLELKKPSVAEPVVNILDVTVPLSLKGVNLVVMEEPKVIPRDCLEVQQKIGNVTGVYTILPDGCGQAFQVYCDMDTAGGGWTVFQRRQDGSVDFGRPWGTYRRGFGRLLGEFWLGLDKMSRLTAQDDYELRVDLQDYNGTRAEAEYESIRISDTWGNFRLNLGEFKANGSAGDSLSYHSNMPFTTHDRDNDLAKTNCAERYSGGGWWFNECLYSNLNGLYLGQDNEDFATGVTWYKFSGFYDSIKFAEMKVRPVM